MLPQWLPQSFGSIQLMAPKEMLLKEFQDGCHGCHWESWMLFFNCVLIGVAPNTQLRTCVIKIVTFKGGHDCSYHKELLLKEIIRSL